MNITSKRHFRSFAIVFAVGAAIAMPAEAPAQPTSPDPYPNKSASDLMKQYSTSFLGTLNSQNMLMGVLIKHLPSTDANIALVRQNLAKPGPSGDKILLVKLLASMYTPRAQSQQNLLIENDIKKLAESSDKQIAVGALIEYSRLAYPADRYQVLQRAHSSKIIDDDTYYGELAHGLRFSTPAQQVQMLDEMALDRNPFGYEVLAATFSSPDSIGQLPQASRIKLLQTLSRREPNFPMALDSFGGFDIARYAIWSDAVSMIDANVTGRPYTDLVLDRLSDTKIDPRKILAVLGSPEGQRIIRENKDAARLQTLYARGLAYANMLPQNVMLSGAVQSFSKQMSSTAANGPGSD